TGDGQGLLLERFQDVDGSRGAVLHAGAERAVPADLRLQPATDRRARQLAASAEGLPVPVCGRIHLLDPIWCRIKGFTFETKGFSVMKGSALAASIALAAITLGAAPVFPQQPPAAAPAQTPPAQTPPKPVAPAQPAAPAPARPPEPFP